MVFLAHIKQFFDRMDTRSFYIFLVSYVVVVFGMGMALVAGLYIKTSNLTDEINELNELREETRIIREKAQQVQTQRAAVHEILSKDPDFKIASYFDDLLGTLHISGKKGKTEITRADREDTYQETELTAQVIDIDMKQVTELLQAIEQTRRIYIKKVDILKTKKGSSLELGIVIATLLPKTE